MKRTIKELVKVSSTRSPGQEGYFEDYYEEETRTIEVKNESNNRN